MSIEFKIVLAMLACYRLTVLLCYDDGPCDLIKYFRNFTLGYTRLLSCPHCVGIWMAIFCVWNLIKSVPDSLMYAMVVLAVAGAQSFMESVLEKKWRLPDE